MAKEMTNEEFQSHCDSLDSWEESVKKYPSAYGFKPKEPVTPVVTPVVTEVVTESVTNQKALFRQRVSRARKYSAQIRKAHELADKDMETLKEMMKGKTQTECNIIVDNYMHMLESKIVK